MRNKYPPPRLIVFLTALLALSLRSQAQYMECTTPASDPVISARSYPASKLPPCNDIANVRVNVHFVQRSNGTGNFNASNDGRPGNPGPATGYTYAESLIWACNEHWDVNPALRIPPGDQLTPRPKRIHLVLNGVYFDRNDDLHNYEGYTNPRSFLKDAGNTINIFLAEVPLQSNGMPSYEPSFGGYAPRIVDCAYSGNEFFTVIRGAWSLYTSLSVQPWQLASTINHEVGHLLGLGHTHTGQSRCADTPANANCWNLNAPPGTNCDQLSEVSNNLMDYNAGQVALSPCQLVQTRFVLDNCGRRYVAFCGSCLPSTIRFSLPEQMCGIQPTILLDGRESFNEAYFTLSIDRLDASGRPIPATHFEQTNWRQLGIESLHTLYSFAAGSRYRVTVTGGNCAASALAREIELLPAPCDVAIKSGPANLPTSTTLKP